MDGLLHLLPKFQQRSSARISVVLYCAKCTVLSIYEKICPFPDLSRQPIIIKARFFFFKLVHLFDSSVATGLLLYQGTEIGQNLCLPLRPLGVIVLSQSSSKVRSVFRGSCGVQLLSSLVVGAINLVFLSNTNRFHSTMSINVIS